MKTQVRSTLIITLLFYLAALMPLNAQLLLKKTSLEKQIANSSLVVEGRVISKESFWDEGHNNIFTVNTIEVFKVFKGIPIATIEVVTAGGMVGLEAEIVTPSLKLRNDYVGVFMLHDNYVELDTKAKLSKKQFKVYGSLQGFYKYILHSNVAINPFNKKEGITTSFYNEIMSHTKSGYVEMTKTDLVKQKINTSQQKSSLPPSSITFTPTTITGGTKTVLTINGSGFGGTQGKVGFSNADTGGFDGGVPDYIEALDTQVVSWSDTQIRVEVPSEAGTGKIQVTDSGNASAESNLDLTVSYSETNLISDNVNSGVNVAYNTQHANDNSSGGYTWRMFTDFDANADAKTSFLRALETWRCETGVNWVVGTTTTVDVVAGDGINVVRFDNGNELGVDVLGRCTSRYSGCFAAGNTTLNWYVSELDIVFDDDTNWNFNTSLPGITQYDFESVALHELGHGHQLAHVIDTNNDVMHYAISNGEDQRVLSANNITSATNVHNRSTGSAVCSASVMTDYSGSCSLSIDEEELGKSINLYPNPAKSIFYINNKSAISLEKAVIYDVSGRLINEYNISNGSRTNSINVTGVSKGIYFVNIHSDRAMITRKMILD
ncbi:T9SS type A sorting domain-containing protein [Flavivirga algicola]|uniref:T9SS type A sorting domain-containing protein n=1 Tax=Flavivirga algicola TaxID=2729136 RepID=A0ABX1RUV9_9FLAO|nr:T9SS type A sorting domain-containing protein [Flavivirga algicola]NMH86946.1 T9SS type A sorting domain-containing protein [Flavivirga algicola]